MKYRPLIFIIFISWMVSLGFSQTQAMFNISLTIPEIAMLDIEPNTNNIIFNFDAPTEAGDPLESQSDNTKWLNYTSAVNLGGLLRNITAQMTITSPLPGLKIELLVSNYIGGGTGDFGIPVGTIDLSTTAQTIIVGIGGCYTVSGANSGHQLDYTVSIYDYSVFEIPATPTMDIIFTISD